MNHLIRQQVIDWANDCVWAENECGEPLDFDLLSDAQLTKAVNVHYVGGMRQFIKDGGACVCGQSLEREPEIRSGECTSCLKAYGD